MIKDIEPPETETETEPSNPEPRALNPEHNQPLTITSLDQLQALVDAPIECVFAIDDTIVRLPCRRMTQDLSEQVRQIRIEAQPPFDPKRGANGDYDYSNPAYRLRHETNLKTARAVIVYAGCPLIAAKKPGLVDKQQIYQFIRGILSEMILELIAQRIENGGLGIVSEAERANFTSAAGLDQS